MAQRLNSIRTQYKALKQEEDDIVAQIKADAMNRNCMGPGIKATRYLVSGRVDYDAIPELKGINLDLYRKPATECYRVTET